MWLLKHTKGFICISCSIVLIFILINNVAAVAQNNLINRNLFFTDANIIEVKLTTDIKALRKNKTIPVWQPALIQMQFSDTLIVNEEIAIQARGVVRKTICDIAALMLNFKTPKSPRLSKLKKLKLVGGCSNNRADEDLLIKEYLVYKMYSILTPMSFRVRLLHITYNDIQQKIKPYAQYAFLIEDIDDVAERSNCIEKKYGVYKTESTNRLNNTFVCLFQYMIGNTDFSIPNRHNVKLIVPKNDTLALPYTIPYDFDYAGIVNAPYAIPREELGISNVRDRLYRGFGRTLEEIEPLCEIFKDKKSAVYYPVENDYLLKEQSKKSMLSYLNEFYKNLTSKRLIKQNFVDNARSF